MFGYIIIALGGSKSLQKKMESVASRHPEKYKIITDGLAALSKMEQNADNTIPLETVRLQAEADLIRLTFSICSAALPVFPQCRKKLK